MSVSTLEWFTSLGLIGSVTCALNGSWTLRLGSSPNWRRRVYWSGMHSTSGLTSFSNYGTGDWTNWSGYVISCFAWPVGLYAMYTKTAINKPMVGGFNPLNNIRSLGSSSRWKHHTFQATSRRFFVVFNYLSIAICYICSYFTTSFQVFFPQYSSIFHIPLVG